MIKFDRNLTAPKKLLYDFLTFPYWTTNILLVSARDTAALLTAYNIALGAPVLRPQILRIYPRFVLASRLFTKANVITGSPPHPNPPVRIDVPKWRPEII